MKVVAICITLIMLSACSTLRPLPERAVHDAADRLIAAVWAHTNNDSSLPLPALDVQHEAGFIISSPDILRLRTQMENRSNALAAEFDAGHIGLGNDGYVTQRDADDIDLDTRNQIRELVSHENADRAALYRELASINRQPQWQTAIGQLFAEHWRRAARVGWWIQNADRSWQRK